MSLSFDILTRSLSQNAEDGGACLEFTYADMTGFQLDDTTTADFIYLELELEKHGQGEEEAPSEYSIKAKIVSMECFEDCQQTLREIVDRGRGDADSLHGPSASQAGRVSVPQGILITGPPDEKIHKGKFDLEDSDEEVVDGQGGGEKSEDEEIELPEAMKRPGMFMDNSEKSVEIDRVPASLDDMDRNEAGAKEAQDVVKATPVEIEPVEEEEAPPTDPDLEEEKEPEEEANVLKETPVESEPVQEEVSPAKALFNHM